MLRGLGAALALPWMESLAGRRPGGRGAASKPPVRMCFWYVPNGVHLPAWFPQHEGTLVDLPETLRPLSFARDYLNCFHGLTHNTALTNGDSEGCGHGQGSASFLTGAQAYKTQDAVRVDISVDQLYARHVGNADPLPQPRAGLRVGPLGQRVRLQRDLQDAHLLADADLARPLRDESQARLRPPVHQGEQQPDAGHRRRSRLLPQEHARLRAGRRQPGPQPRREGRPAQARPVPDRRPRGRTPDPARRRLGGAPRDRLPAARGHPGRLRRAPAPDVRPDGARLPDRQHPGLHLHGHQGSHRPELSRGSASPTATTSSPTTRAKRRSTASSARSTATTSPSWPT